MTTTPAHPEPGEHWAAFYTLHRRRLVAAALLFTRSPAEAEELLHETLTAVIDSVGGSPAPLNDPVAYLITSMRRRAGADRAATQARTEREHHAAPWRTVQHDPPDQDPRLTTALDAVAGLSPAEQETLLLITRAGLTLRQTADVLGQPLGTVSARYQRALRTLRERLAPLAHQHTA